MERKKIQGNEYVIDIVKVDDISVTIIAKVTKHNSSLVEFRSFKPQQNSNLQGQLGIVCSIDEFMGELKLMCNYLNINGISDESFLNSFENLLKKHITEIGRLIDTDLYSYIDKAIILQNSIRVSYGSQLSEENASMLWVELLKFSMKKFNDYIYLTQYEMSNPNSPKPYLVKLTDINK